jgi:hypothetical protein
VAAAFWGGTQARVRRGAVQLISEERRPVDGEDQGRGELQASPCLIRSASPTWKGRGTRGSRTPSGEVVLGHWWAGGFGEKRERKGWASGWLKR